MELDSLVHSFNTSNVRYNSSLASASCCYNFLSVGVSYPHWTHLCKNLSHTKCHLTFKGDVFPWKWTSAHGGATMWHLYDPISKVRFAATSWTKLCTRPSNSIGQSNPGLESNGRQSVLRQKVCARSCMWAIMIDRCRKELKLLPRTWYPDFEPCKHDQEYLAKAWIKNPPNIPADNRYIYTK